MNKLATYFYLFRYWQWLKNILIFVPLFLTDFTKTNLLIDHLVLFVLFSFFVSSTYILNDIKDFKEDRKHPSKNKRPIASGQVSQAESIFLSALLLFTTIYLTYYFYGLDIISLFLCYLLLTIFYSYKLKYIIFLDGFAVSFLYIIRLLIGGQLSEITISIQLTIYVFLLSLTIFYLKKNSILNTNDYTNRMKEFIKLQNSRLPISVILNGLVTILNISLMLWMVEFIDSKLDFLFAFLFITLHILLLKDLISLSQKGLIEDLAKAVFSFKNVKIKIIFTFTFFVLFYYV
jgi:4-hydroxybenzoate polyprenyltransferase